MHLQRLPLSARKRNQQQHEDELIDTPRLRNALALPLTECGPRGAGVTPPPHAPFGPGPPPEFSSAFSAFSTETCRWGCARPFPRWSTKVKSEPARSPSAGKRGRGLECGGAVARERQSGPSEQLEVTTRFFGGGAAEGDILLELPSKLLPCPDYNL